MIKFCLKNAHTRQILFAIFLVTGLVNCGSGTHANPLAATPSPQKQYGVQVSSPANNSTVGTTVNFAASAATTCATGVASIGIFTAPGVLAYKVNGATVWVTTILLDRSLRLSPAAQLSEISRSLETTGREYYQQACQQLKSDAAAGRVPPVPAPEADSEFQSSNETERFSLTGDGGNTLVYLVRTPRGIVAYSRPLEVRMLTPISLAISIASVVLPSPGGPKNRA